MPTDATQCVCRPTAFRKPWREAFAERYGSALPPHIRAIAEEWDASATVPIAYLSMAELARHEAAHAIAAVETGAGVRTAVIQQKSDTWRRGLVVYRRDFRNTDDRILTALAGLSATAPRDLYIEAQDLQPHIAAARERGSQIRCDLCWTFKCLIDADHDAPDFSLTERYRELERKTASFVRRPDIRRRIEAVADALLQREILSGDDIREIERRCETMISRTIEIPEQYRRAEVRSSSYSKADRTIEVIWTTGAKVRRRSWVDGPYDEELIVTPDAVRLDRLNAGAPFLNTHNDWDLSDVLGSVVPGTARIEGGLGLARVKLSTAPGDADNVQKIVDGIVRNVSVGYAIHRVEKIETDDGNVPTWRVVDWEPVEISAVPIPADPGAQVRSGEKVRTFSATLIDRAGIGRIEATRARMRLRARSVGVRIRT